MKFNELLETVGSLPLFRGSLLLAGDRNPEDVRRQLSRWKASGKILQLRRNLYTLAPPWRRVDPHPFLIANELLNPSYVSLQSALAYYGLIPEAVPVTTSVTTGRTCRFDTPFGRFEYRHIHPDIFFGYSRVLITRGQEVLISQSSKALLDLVYLTPKGDSYEHLESLRLEDLDTVFVQDLYDYAHRWGKDKIKRAAEHIVSMKESEQSNETVS